MAKKAAKKRKTTSIAPKEEASANLGTVNLTIQTFVGLTGTGTCNELVIEWGCLGLSEEPDKVTEVSANNRLLDPKRPITTSEEGLHIFFDPPLAASGNIGLQFLCTYNEAVEARTSAPKSDDKYADEDEAA